MKISALPGALALSLIVHTAVFSVFSLPGSPLKAPAEPIKMIEVAYVGISAVEKKTPVPEDNRPTESKIPQLPGLSEIVSKEKPFAAATKLARKETLQPFTKEETLIKKTTVSMPNIPGEIFKTPEYKSYYQMIREKIRRYAYTNYDNIREKQEGEVYLTFILGADGGLLELTINDKKSTVNASLRSVAERSVRNAAPFPALPEKLRLNKKMSFSVIITFELKQN